MYSEHSDNEHPAFYGSNINLIISKTISVGSLISKWLPSSLHISSTDKVKYFPLRKKVGYC